MLRQSAQRGPDALNFPPPNERGRSRLKTEDLRNLKMNSEVYKSKTLKKSFKSLQEKEPWIARAPDATDNDCMNLSLKLFGRSQKI